MSRSAVSGEHFAIVAPLAAGELAVKTIEQSVDQLHLSPVQWRSTPVLPKSRFGQHSLERLLRKAYGSVQRIKKPSQPLGDIE